MDQRDKRKASSLLRLVMRTITNAGIDARTFSHAQARAKPYQKKKKVFNISEMLCILFMSGEERNSSSETSKNGVREDIRAGGHYTFHMRRNR